MGKQARERAVREFSLETMAVKVLDLYEDSLFCLI